MIKRLYWDSDFFGYPVGKVELKSSEQFDVNDLIKENENFKLVYVITDVELKSENKEMELVDIKTRFRKSIKADYDSLSENIGEYTGGEDGQLEKLALQSGAYSRFRIDKHFHSNEFENLYLKWIKESISKTIADAVIVYKQEGSDCSGFVTLKLKDGFSEIGLIAVDEQSRGKGIAKNLLDYADRYTLLNGLDKIEVVTQYKNTPAMKLYEKAGYQIVSTKYIYHLWN